MSCGCTAQSNVVKTVNNYLLPFITTEEQTVIKDNANCRATHLLNEAATYWQAGYSELAMKSELKANVIYQILFTLDRVKCIKQDELNRLILYLQRVGNTIPCN